MKYSKDSIVKIILEAQFVSIIEVTLEFVFLFCETFASATYCRECPLSISYCISQKWWKNVLFANFLTAIWFWRFFLDWFIGMLAKRNENDDADAESDADGTKHVRSAIIH